MKRKWFSINYIIFLLHLILHFGIKNAKGYKLLLSKEKIYFVCLDKTWACKQTRILSIQKKQLLQLNKITRIYLRSNKNIFFFWTVTDLARLFHLIKILFLFWNIVFQTYFFNQKIHSSSMGEGGCVKFLSQHFLIFRFYKPSLVHFHFYCWSLHPFFNFDHLQFLF